jgi:hypothetical protein
MWSRRLVIGQLGLDGRGRVCASGCSSGGSSRCGGTLVARVAMDLHTCTTSRSGMHRARATHRQGRMLLGPGAEVEQASEVGVGRVWRRKPVVSFEVPRLRSDTRRLQRDRTTLLTFEGRRVTGPPASSLGTALSGMCVWPTPDGGFCSLQARVARGKGGGSGRAVPGAHSGRCRAGRRPSTSC